METNLTINFIFKKTKTMPRGIGGSVLRARTQLSRAGTNKVASWKGKPQCRDSLCENPATLSILEFQGL